MQGLDLFSAAPPQRVRTYPAGPPPSVCDLFERLALEIRAKGFQRYSARAIIHRIRWHMHIERGDKDFKINNIWTPGMARWFIAQHPTMSEFFELRSSPGASSDEN